MKKHIHIALLGATLAVSFAAHAEGIYVGANVGSAESKLITAGGSIKDRDTGLKLLAGYDFSKNFGVEIGLANLDKWSQSGVNYDPSALYVAATGTVPLSNEFSLIGKLGLSANRATVSIPAGSQTFRNTAPLIGVGAVYKLSNSISLVAEYDNFGKILDEQGVKIKADMLSVGLRLTF